ncbi:MAG: hypothetical protein MJK18_15850, partial [Bdellovibrionales bacterium]|nr:hypothetical protein [Bdellovibrionales bacterium]
MSNKNDEYEVKVIKKPKVHDQFGKRTFISKKQKPLAISAAIGAAIITGVPFLTDVRPNRVKKISGIKAPSHIKPVIIDIPTYSFTEELTIERKRPRRRKKIIHYRGAQVFSRPLSERVLPGSMLKAELVSGASNGLIKAKSIEALRVLGDTVIPSGSIFIGTGS